MNLMEMQHLVEKGTFAQLREAMTRTEFYQFMAKGVKGLLVDAYSKALAETTWQEITVTEESDSDKEDYPSIGAPALPREKGEGMPYEVLNSGSPDNVTVTNYTYGGIIELTNEADRDDKSPGKALRKQAMELGPAAARHKDRVFYSLITANGTSYDGTNIFSLNHPGYNGGAARGNNDNIYTAVTLSANALATALGIISRWEGADPDQDLDVKAERLVVPTTLSLTAHGLVSASLLPLAYAAGALGPAASNGQMPSGLKDLGLKVTSSYRLDRQSLTDWYIKTNFPGFIHQMREGLTVVAEAPNAGKSFENGMLRWAVSNRWGRRFLNWRWGIFVS